MIASAQLAADSAKVRLLVQAGLCLLVGWAWGCRGLSEPGPEIQRQVRELSVPDGAVRRRASVELEASGLFGNYVGAAVLRAGEEPAARLQLLPNVGSKLLDLAVNGDRISGYFPAAGVRVDHGRANGTPPRHVLVFLAASLLEQVVPLEGRVLGVILEDEDGVVLRAEGALEGVALRVRLDGQGRVAERRYRLRHVSWTETVEGDRRAFRGRGFGWTMTDIEETGISDPGDALFQLELPPEDQP